MLVNLTKEQIDAIKNVVADCRWQANGFNGVGDMTDNISVSMYRRELDALLSLDLTPVDSKSYKNAE